MMLTVATLFWQKNEKTAVFSSDYDESWVRKLYYGFERNLTEPFQFVLYTDAFWAYGLPITQRLLSAKKPAFEDCLQPYEMGVPMILVGLDTVIVGNIDHLARYCLDEDINEGKLALPRDPFHPSIACNGVALVPAGMEKVWTERIKGQDDMTAVRRWPHQIMDDMPAFAGQVKSYKGHIKAKGLEDIRIAYFHGLEKPHQLPDVAWIAEHWVDRGRE